MQRFNSFNMIHKALRAMMYDTALILQQTFFGDVKEAAVALGKVETIIYEFEQHAHHEDTFMLPAIEAYEPELVEKFEKEHVADIEIGNRLQVLLHIYRSLETSEERINCGSCINKSFRDFMVFNIEHMSKEEIEINRVLWANYTDEELLALNERLTASIPPEKKINSAKWMLRSINKMEAITWLQSVKETAPSFIFDALIEMAGTELPENIREEVLDAIMVEELLF
ncbi:MAG TPA: hemerythrin domain-containing protein [Segetibacter sp.]|nr:hemerythrin domain-containing protein [Segetibacter sp.]